MKSQTIPLSPYFGKKVAEFIILALIALSYGCGKAAFTHQLRVDNQLTDTELRNIQYYISNEITMQRALTKKLKIED